MGIDRHMQTTSRSRKICSFTTAAKHREAGEPKALLDFSSSNARGIVQIELIICAGCQRSSMVQLAVQ